MTKTAAPKEAEMKPDTAPATVPPVATTEPQSLDYDDD